jgi:acetyltransferase-like isoleucine patch superfamily enzyme
LLRQVRVRLLQVLALYAPGARTARVALHRLRGVEIGARTFIGTSVILETSRPELISIGSECTISVRAVVIAHFRGKTAAERGVGGERFSVKIEDRAFVGPGAIVLEGVTIGEGAVVTAGSVVSSSVPPGTMVQGNPARAIARCRVPLLEETRYGEFLRNLEPIK